MSHRPSPQSLSRDLYEPRLDRLIVETCDRFHVRLRCRAPALAPRISEWLRTLVPEGDLLAYIQHPRAYPLMLLPWWLAGSLTEEVDEELHEILSESSLHGYLYVRLLDNVMDGEATVETRLLPVAGYFHAYFQGAYHRLFPPEHEFWELFHRIWARSAEATVEDACLEEIDEECFLRISGQKFCGAKIPVAATCHFYQRADLVPPWCEFLDLLGAWHQMANDLFDWLKDRKLGLTTFVLCEAERRREPTETAGSWFAREGFAWGAGKLEAWMTDLQTRATMLDCPPLARYLEMRADLLVGLRRQAERGLEVMRDLRAVFSPTRHGDWEEKTPWPETRPPTSRSSSSP